MAQAEPVVGKNPLNLGSRRELFTDRFLIEDMKGTELRLHSPQRKETAISPGKEFIRGT
jgi:hypothetical protein